MVYPTPYPIDALAAVSGECVTVTQDQFESENRRDIEDCYGEKNQTAQHIDADNEIQCRRVVPYRLLPVDNRIEVDPLVERRPAPGHRDREE